MMEKASSCFICGQQFDFNELNEHEKTCLENIKANDIQYTRQNTEEHASSVSSRPESLSLSNHSASSNESYEKKYLRCYICGTDVPTYLKGIHEKACKKNWESGLLNVDRKTNVRADMFRSLSRSSSRAEINTDAAPKTGGLRKAKSSTLYRRASCNNALSVSNDDLRGDKNSKSATNLNKSSSKSATNLSKNASKSATSLSKNSKSATNLSKSQSSILDRASDEYFNNLGPSSSSQTELTRHMDLYLDLDISDGGAPMRNATSVSSLHVDVPTRTCKANGTNKTKSLQDLRKKDRGATSPRSPTSPTPPTSPRSFSSPTHKQKTSPSNPQYVVCHLCGKLYSQHSIVIHVKQCEKTRALRHNVGTNVDYKIKSRSLADLSKGNLSKPRVNSISNLASTGRTSRPSTARSYDRTRNKSSMSSSMDNLSLGNKMDKFINDMKKENNSTAATKEKANSREPSTASSLSTPGLQKCYLCGQLYGTRSLPIHQKQCYVKQERLREQEGQTKRKKKKDIKVLPFGRPNFADNLATGTPNHSPATASATRPHSASRTTGTENGAKRNGLGTSPPRREPNGDVDGRSTCSSMSSENDYLSPRSPASPISVRDMMMTCVHCACQCEPYTMAIHEKVCRKVTSEENKANPEIRIESNHASSHVEEKITNGGLIHCEGCGGEFFSSEIFQHRINCRTSTL